MVSIVILRTHQQQGHGATFRCPISNSRSHLSAILYVDDSDVIHVNMEDEETVTETHQRLQDSVLSWGKFANCNGWLAKTNEMLLPSHFI